MKMGQAPKVTAEDGGDFDTAQTVRDVNFLLMETTIDEKLLKTLVALERQ